MQTVSSLQSVEAAIVEINGKMTMISDITRDQTAGISSLNASLAEIGAVTQRNAVMFEETNAACANLAQGAEVLRALTLRFKTSPTGKPMAQVA